MRLLWLCLMVLALTGGWLLPPAIAQDTAVIDLNETITGTLLDINEEITYTFAAPLAEDIVVLYEGTGVVRDRYTVTTVTPGGTVTEEIPLQPGGGGDTPVSRQTLIPAFTLPQTLDDPIREQTRTIEFTLQRPIPGPADYTLTAHAVAPQRVAGGGAIRVEPAANVPVQVFTVDVDLTQPFFVQVEVPDVNGTTLWAASIPEQAALLARIHANDVDTPGSRPIVIDSATGGDDLRGVFVYYVGASQFRIVVEATSPYRMAYNVLAYRVLSPGESQTLMLSYQVPVRLLRLNAAGANDVTLNLRVTDGSGAFVSLYEADSIPASYGERTALGNGSPNPNARVAELATTLTAPVVADGEMAVVVQVPFFFERSAVTVDVEWTDVPADR